jgi:hypothetical protein
MIANKWQRKSMAIDLCNNQKNEKCMQISLPIYHAQQGRVWV